METPRSIWPNWEAERPYAVLLLGVLTMFFLGQFVGVMNDIRLNQFIGRAPTVPNTITIVGEGRVSGVPDIATVDLGMLTSSKRVAEAQAENTRKMNDLTGRLKQLGIEDKDLKTSQYSISPRYDYQDGRSVLSGYDVQQTLTVKVRNLEKLSTALQIAGEVGSNQIGGLNFTVDEPETLRQEARRKAIANAREKADALAGSIGVRLGPVVSFNESVSGDTPPPYPYAYAREALGAGGGGTPDVKQGSVEVISNVTLSYELR